VQAVRKATRAAALSGETDPQRLVAVAEANLAPSATPQPAAAQAAPPAQSPAAEPEASHGQGRASRSRKGKRNRLSNFLKRVAGGR
jgi:hypothetical protein